MRVFTSRLDDLENFTRFAIERQCNGLYMILGYVDHTSRKCTATILAENIHPKKLYFLLLERPVFHDDEQ